MNPTLARAIALACLLSPAALHALGLGDIRLNSALNQPFDAEIELVAATDEDLAALRASLASNETFSRYGLDKPAYLSDFRFQVTRGSNGRDVLRVTSPRPVTEPFVTLLVEANWPRGRLLREYTVLLDPPTFASGQPVAVAAQAPSVASAEAAPAARTAPPAAVGEEARAPVPPAPTPSAPTRPRPVAAPLAGVTDGNYRVLPNDTLWRIASRVDAGSQGDVNQAMVAIYRSNPEAFDGNINLIRSGAQLRLPEPGEVTAIPADAAAVEVARQYRLWQDGTGSAASAGAGAGRLRLVAPQTGGATASTATASSAATATAGAALESRVRDLESQLAETRRLLELQSAELANLQGLAGPSPAPSEPLADAAPEPLTDAPVTEPGAGADPAPVEGDAVMPVPAPVAEPEPVAEKPAKRAAQTPPAAEEPGLLERLDPFKWPLLGGLLLALLGALAWQKRRRTADSADESLEETFAARSERRAARKSGDDEETDFTKSDILVEERKPLEPVLGSAAAATITARSVASMPEQAHAGTPAAADDALAEADFHMAYGLYDQAAQLVKSALDRQPARRDLQLKLLEVWFVSGNRERFLELARHMHADAGGDAVPDWDKVIIMGRQIAPEDALFGAALEFGGSGLDLDLEFASATGHIDPLTGVGDRAPPDLDLGAAAAAAANESGLDFVLDEPGRGTDLDLGQNSPTVEMPRPIASTVEVPRPVAPTVEVPVATIDRTDEMSIDRLGLDVGTLSAIEELDHELADELARNDASGLDGTSELEALHEDAALLEESVDDLLSTTAMLKSQTGTLGALTVIVEAGEDTGSLSVSTLRAEVATVEATRVRGAIEETQLASELTAYADVSFPMSSEEASTLSEVGTKLDLARAYIDMGDPEGARSILDEVVEEGSDAQQGEARRLIAALP